MEFYHDKIVMMIEYAQFAADTNATDLTLSQYIAKKDRKDMITGGEKKDAERKYDKGIQKQKLYLRELILKLQKKKYLTKAEK